jgi:glycosyltransferase involved in cell wall biosynthesis
VHGSDDLGPAAVTSGETSGPAGRDDATPMRILYVVHQFFPEHISGTEQYVLSLARAGRAAGDDVRVYTVDPDGSHPDRPANVRAYVHRGVPVVCHDYQKGLVKNGILIDWWNPQNAASFTRLLDEFRPDVVHFFHFRFIGIDRIAEARARRIPVVVHLMDFWFVCPNYLLLRVQPPGDGVQCDGPPEGGYGCFDCVNPGIAQWAREPWARGRHVERRAAGEFPANENSGEQAGFAMVERPRALAAALREATLVISPSRTVQAALEQAGAAPPALAIVPYAIDRALVDALPPAPRERVHFGFMGTFAPHKGLAVLLEAMRGLPDRDVVLHAHGRFGHFGAYDDRLREIAAGDARIEFAGAFDHDRLAPVLSGLHALVVPSLWRENTPFVCLEARAAGIELVVSDLAGMTECVPPGSGCAFPAGDAAALRARLSEVAARVRARRFARLAVDRTIQDVTVQYADFRARYSSLAR